LDSIDKIKAEVQQEIKKVSAEATDCAQQAAIAAGGIGLWKIASIAMLALLVVCYLFWSFAHTRHTAGNASTPVTPAPAITVSKVAGPRLSVPLQVVPSAAVHRAMPGISVPPGQEVVDTADIPETDNGVQTVTFMNLSTGTARTVYVSKLAPWFALEDKNTLGAGYEASSTGDRIPIYYRRDIVRVKDLHLVGELGGKIPVGPGRLEGHAAGYLELRF